jgi:hypothetical protein
MWTRETKNLKEGYYWYRSEWTDHEGKKIVNEEPIYIESGSTHGYPDTMRIGDDCCGPSLFTEDMERGNSWIWDEPIIPPEFVEEKRKLIGE